jgi:hypothetical protein
MAKRGGLLSLEVLSQRQGGVVLRHRSAEGAEFGEGEIEGHGSYEYLYCMTFFQNNFYSMV